MNESNKQQLDILKSRNERCIVRTHDNKHETVSNCDHLIRIAHCLKFYQSQCKDIQNSNGAEEFTDFCRCGSYPLCFDDYIHFIDTHSRDIHCINKDLQKNYNINACDHNNSNQCTFMRRHYRDRNAKSQNTKRNKYNVFIDMFDGIHCYLFHRKTLTNTYINASKYLLPPQHVSTSTTYTVSDTMNEAPKRTFIDNMLIDIGDNININTERKNKLGQYICDQDFDSDCIMDDINICYRNNNYCNILNHLNHDHDMVMFPRMKQFMDYGKSSDIRKYYTYFKKNNNDNRNNTFIDNVLIYIENKYVNDDDINDCLNTLRMYICNEHYDTESMIAFIKCGGNIIIPPKLNNNIDCIKSIKQFIEYYNKVSKPGFSVGVTFWYWQYYEHIDDEQIKQTQKWSEQQNDFGGVSIKDLFVKKHYNSLKEEVISSEFIDIDQYNEMSTKAEGLCHTQKCKAMKCIHKNDSDPLHYGIKTKTPLKKEHMYCVVLYCDFTVFCTDFRSSFRKNTLNESLIDIKSRNSKYYHMSKYLRELVQYYGVNNKWPKNRGQYSGPFYCGMSVIINISSFSIRLNAPISTSTQKEIADNFSGSNGIIIQFNNIKYPGKLEPFLNASWISSFPEEDERIFCGGWNPVQVESVIVKKTKKNYLETFSALYKFDALLSGQELDKVTRKDMKWLSLLLNEYLGHSSKLELEGYCGITFHPLAGYIADTFYLFCHQKTQITLNLYDMDHNYNGCSELINLIMYPIDSQHVLNKQNTTDIGNKYNNLFKCIVFKLFPNLQEIIIYSTSHIHKPFVYPFNITELLRMISVAILPKSFKNVIIKDRKQVWLHSLYELKFNQHSKISLKEKQGVYKDEDWMVIYV